MPWVHEDAVLLPNLLASRLELSLWGSYWRSRNQAAGWPRALGTAPLNSARGTSSGGVGSSGVGVGGNGGGNSGGGSGGGDGSGSGGGSGSGSGSGGAGGGNSGWSSISQLHSLTDKLEVFWVSLDEATQGEFAISMISCLLNDFKDY